MCYMNSGGGNRRNLELDVADTPLLWMANEAAKAGLKLGLLGVEWDWDRLQQSKPTESLGWVWWLLELWPFKRLTYLDKVDTTSQ